jgi:putative oxidoreductase
MSGYLAFVKVLEIAGGLLVWSGRYTALGLVILVPIIINILCYDVFLLKGFNPVSTLALLLSLFLLWTERSKFVGLFR